MQKTLNRAIFLDRDGVINRKAPEGQYITRWEDFHFLPGIAEGIASLNHAGFRVVVVTNQRCVAKGLISEPELKSLHERMLKTLEGKGAIVEAVFYCPHDSEARCDCRKPEPGMLQQAARALELELKSSWMIGDSESDVEAGRRAGSKTVLLTGNITPKVGTTRADVRASTFLEAVQELLSREPAFSDRDSATIHIEPQ